MENVGERVEMSAPLKGRPNRVIPILVHTIENVVSDDMVEEFCVGRSIDLDAAKTKHGCNSIVALYETESGANVIEVEDELIKKFRSHPKCGNVDQEVHAATSDKFANFIYLAVWYSDKDPLAHDPNPVQ
ncbi:MAG TPA: hypothetical protein VIS48_08250 [Candidatus Kryptonia bacterium]